MPKKSAKKIKEGAEENKITPPTKPDIKKYINEKYAHNARANKWVWMIAIIFMVVILALWAWIIKIQLAQLSWQATQESMTSKLRQNWDQNFEKLRDQEIGVQKLGRAWNQIIADLSSSTVAESVTTTTSTLLDTTTASSTPSSIITNIQTTTNR